MFRYVAFLSIGCSCWAEVTVTHAAGKWTIAGKKNTVALNESDLAVEIKAGPADWKMMPSSNRDMRVTAGSDEFYMRLADAGNIRIAPYETGFKRASGSCSTDSPIQE